MPMSKKTRKAIKKLAAAVEELREQNEELARELTGALERQAEELRVLARILGSHLDAPDRKVAGAPGDRVGSREEPEATEAAVRRAEELGVDLSGVEGTGAGGRILVKDVEEAAGAED